jgi:hypothetical protein
MTTVADCVTVTRRGRRAPKGHLLGSGPPRRCDALPPEDRVTASQGETECGNQQSVTRDLGQ